MSFNERLNLAPIFMVWIFIVLPVGIGFAGGAGFVLWCFGTAALCFLLVRRNLRERR